MLPASLKWVSAKGERFHCIGWHAVPQRLYRPADSGHSMPTTPTYLPAGRDQASAKETDHGGMRLFVCGRNLQRATGNRSVSEARVKG